MASLFDRLKNSRGTNATAMQSRLEQQGQGGYRKDARIWKWSWNKDGVSENIIRLLPIPMVDLKRQEDGEIPADFVLTPVALILKHSFQGKGGWYINNSLQTFGEDCPVRDHDRPIWAQLKERPDEALKNKMKERLPSSEYYVNILVISDGTDPSNNGQVRLLQYGNALKKFIDTAQNPKFSTDIKFDPFDAWEGANILLNLSSEDKNFGGRTVKCPKFDNVKWDKQAPLGDDAFIQEIWEKEHSLYEFYDRKNYKTYAELEDQLRKVLQIPADQPLIENGAGTMAHSPTPTQTQTQAQNQQPQQSEQKAADPAPTGTGAAGASQASPTGSGGQASVDDFEAYLKQAE
uniref:Single-stranded DNA-binding protein n=1 Tax=Serratia phage Kevin TaxID=3161161 RepID=A0AAU8KWU7_9CAUD